MTCPAHATGALAPPPALILPTSPLPPRPPPKGVRQAKFVQYWRWWGSFLPPILRDSAVWPATLVGCGIRQGSRWQGCVDPMAAVRPTAGG